jgi:hypothetical protein
MKASKKHRVATLATAAALTITAAAAGLVATALPAAAVTICEQFGTVDSSGYVIMNNRWGSPGPQCINTSATGFTITQQDGMGNTSGAPASYPAIYLGCHYTRCSQTATLPRVINQIGSAPTQVSVSYPSSGTWNAAFDIWLNATNDVSGVQDTEIMIWLNRQGSIQPIGSPVGTVNLAGRSWQVWTGSNGQNNVVSYLFQGSPITQFNADVMDFVRDTIGRGSQWGNSNWWLTSIQMGFEPWIGGVGLTVNSFNQQINTGTQNPQVPGTPGTPSCTTTSNSVSLNWGASSGTVSQYLVERATGATSTSFSQIGTSTTTSFNDGGRAANTTYRYRVRAQNSAGTSGFSGTVNCTTQGTGTQPPGTPGTPSCTTTSNSVSLSWGASSGTVSQYLVERATGATSTSFSQIGTATSTSLVDGGRAANTTYRYRVRAQNSAGTSGYSGIANCTTTGGPTTTTSQPPGGCSATYTTVNAWSGGFQGGITVTNTSSSTITSWRITFSLGGATINNFWGGRASGTSYVNEPWNGTLTPGASTQFGFVANGSAPSNVTVTCTTPA